jgi:hypothetical protein
MSNMTLRGFWSAASCLVALGAFACGVGPRLLPAEDAFKVPGLDHAAAAADNYIEVIAQTSRWPGNVRVTRAVQPVRVHIVNNSGRPVQLRYEHFRLVSDDGEEFPAIPALSIQDVTRADGYAAPIEPRFKRSSFSVAPYHAYAYTNVTVYQGPFARNAAHYETYGGLMASARLPTPLMQSWALPEGVLDSGGRVDGYLFFQRVPSDKTQVRLEGVLHAAPTADSGGVPPESSALLPGQLDERTRVASVSIPFSVAK